jgi:hypothetical protein
VGVVSTTGLIGVVSLPRAFVFRPNFDDAHPSPWIRVKLSAALGDALYPHPQWSRLDRLWDSFYPLDGLDQQRQQLFRLLEATVPALVRVLLEHRPRALGRRTLAATMATADRQPWQLGALYRRWRLAPAEIQRAAPALAFAVIGQARADGTIEPEVEARLISHLLKHWALRSALDASIACAGRRRTPVVAVPRRAPQPLRLAIS